MRSFLGFVVFTAALVALVAAFLVPPIVGPLVASAVRAASPFGDRPLEVEVDVDALGLARGFVSEIRISGSDLEADGVRIGTLEMTVTAVETGEDHRFANVSGRFDSVIVSRADGTSISVRRVTLSGPSTGVLATATLDAAQALVMVRQKLADAEVEATEVELIDGGVAFIVSGQRVQVPLVVADGALVVPVLGPSPIPVFEPEPSDPWRITGVSIHPSGLEIEASVQTERLLAN